MKNNEKFWKTSEIILGVIGGALTITALVLKLIGKEILYLAYPIVGIVVLFLICDEFARSIRRRREKEKAEQEKREHPASTEEETALPSDAFEFEPETEEKKS